MEAATVRERASGQNFPNPFKHPVPRGPAVSRRATNESQVVSCFQPFGRAVWSGALLSQTHEGRP